MPYRIIEGDADAVGVFTSPFNIAAKNKGLELAWQQPLWGNFGALLNYNYADGHAADGSALVGSSKHTANGEKTTGTKLI